MQIVTRSMTILTEARLEVGEHSVVGHQRDDDQSVEGSASEVNNEEDGLDWSSPSTPDFRGNGKHGLGRVG